MDIDGNTTMVAATTLVLDIRESIIITQKLIATRWVLSWSLFKMLLKTNLLGPR